MLERLAGEQPPLTEEDFRVWVAKDLVNAGTQVSYKRS